MARRTLLALVAVALVSLPAAAARRRAVDPQRPVIDTAYLNAARETASWLTSMELRPAGGGIAWPYSNRQAFPTTGLSHGAAGIGSFFLRLHQVTGDAQYLDKARGAADYIAAEYAQRRVGGYDWQSGAVGAGEFFVLMYRATHEAKYLDEARKTGDILLAQSIRNDGGIHWEFPGNANVFTGVVHGAAGAGLFFLHLYDISGRPEYLDVARETYRWMRPHTVPIGTDGIGWKRLTLDSTAYHGFCGGSSGIVYFIDELHRATGDEAYRHDLVGTANGLVNAAVAVTPDQAAWRYGTSAGTSRPVIYCHGTSCAISALGHAWARTGEERFRELATAGGRRLDTIAGTIHGDGPVWQHIENTPLVETGFQTGAASVGHAYLRIHAAFGQQKDLDQAKAIGDYLLRIADRPAPGQTRWLNYLQQPPSATDVPAYMSGWYDGAAGIGLFLLELHERTRGVAPAERFSPVNP